MGWSKAGAGAGGLVRDWLQALWRWYLIRRPPEEEWRKGQLSECWPKTLSFLTYKRVVGKVRIPLFSSSIHPSAAKLCLYFSFPPSLSPSTPPPPGLSVAASRTSAAFADKTGLCRECGSGSLSQCRGRAGSFNGGGGRRSRQMVFCRR